MGSFTKVALWTLSAVVVIAIIAGGVIAFNFSGVKDSIGNALDRSVADEAEMPEEDEELAALANPGSKESEEAKEAFEVSDEKSNDGLPSERQFADSIHHMTHQKVKAQQKWGHLEITDERIEQKYETAKKSDYEYREFYMAALEDWMEGDFTNAVQVHNTIWNERDGTIGKARGLMTPEEEMDYKIRHFD
ncbi:DUF6241 domain-containing protein [Salinicoccus roseus]|uniref:DUF6241 domain-containing protein n=1 Tax=Salinicoccus roseus TaxID=45670 RepID=UPI002300CCB3|nr:DUF6241 domain-containing protein [Salinicoccus roseus]